MSYLRKFHDEPVNRLIVSVTVVVVVDEVDELIAYGSKHWRPLGGTHPASSNRTKFVCLAILEKLEQNNSQ